MRDGPLFSMEEGGYRDWEKIVCMRKIAEINCLHSGKVGEFKKNCLHSGKVGEFKKIVCTVSGGEKICKH